MTSKQDEANRFLDLCLELQLLSVTDVEALRSVAVDQYALIAQIALRRGLLSPTDVDIVESLQFPTRVVPSYEILDLVGRGGMGVVYRARQIDLDRQVALKTILVSNVSNPTAAARFEREARALARLQHPNIVQALNFGKHQGRYHFAMEFVEGRSCEQALREDGIMPPENVWLIVRQVASGLLHARRHDLIHRDIKPANLILVTPPEGSTLPQGSEMVKITDFGLALFATPQADDLKLTTVDKIMGSPAYMSPEQFGGEGVDFRTDIYALGATAWHLLFGSAPFSGRSVAALSREKQEPLVIDASALPVLLPDAQLQLLQAMMDPDPNQRPQSYEALIRWIDQLVEAESVTSPQTTVSAPPIASGADVSTHGFSPVSRSDADSIADSVTQTVELMRSDSAAVPANRKRAIRTLWIVAVAILAMLGTIIGYAWWSAPTRGPRDYLRVVDSEPLFDGESLSGWDTDGSMVGAWNTVVSPDSATAIASTSRRSGLTRRVPPSDHPRISLFVLKQRGGGTVDIDFAFDPTIQADPRGTLRVTDKTLELGVKSGDFDPLSSVSQLQLPRGFSERSHVVYLERQLSDWYVFLETKFIGSIPLSRIGTGTSIRLVVHDADNDAVDPPYAFFTDVRLDRLQ
ncbi:serine/threonine-protein kinase [Novipirellula artificiosorum]|uniref:Serine/threonine-protein kinase PrkC n=1 Tax=Novipirellula artificiosorum TaxID=2528016 RepID=A0A5C6E0P2_9BACT|nr:serine/threonine-protein kinase [Novipirellula artificiosorum]TWU40916.1 Serine/threonine-protein kinase PrkC [Novipirellula artificiosorum]